MKKTMAVLSLLFLSSGTAAIAQGGNKGATDQGMNNGGVTQAPVGHRQPRVGDVPDEKNLGNPNDAMSKEDAALDKKIKSICRGC